MSAKRMPPTRKVPVEKQGNRKALYILGGSLLFLIILLSVFILIQ